MLISVLASSQTQIWREKTCKLLAWLQISKYRRSFALQPEKTGRIKTLEKYRNLKGTVPPDITVYFIFGL
jgi:hypothetical protein